MKTIISNTLGVVTYLEGNKIILSSSYGIEIKGDLTIAGTTTTNARVDDRIIELAYGSTGSASSAYDAGIIINRGDDDNVFFGWDESVDLFKVATGTFTGTSTENLSLTPAGIASLSVTSNSLTGSNTITVPESGLIIGSTAVTATAAEINAMAGAGVDSTELGYLNAVTAGTAAASKALVLDASSNIATINSLTATALVGDLTGDVTGDLTGNVTGNCSGTAATVTTAAQTSITSLGTLSALAISGNLTVDTSTLCVDSSNNRVGIGTATPSELLHLKSSTSEKPELVIENANADAYSSLLRFYNSTSTPAASDQIGLIRWTGKNDNGDDADFAWQVGKSPSVGDGTHNGSLHFGVYSGGAGSMSTLSLIGSTVANKSYACFGDPWQSSQTTMVGIHTSAPAKMLDINAMGSANGIQLTWNDADGSAADYATITVEDTNGLLKLATVDSDGASGHIALMPDGNVGIGTATPSKPLHLYESSGEVEIRLQSNSSYSSIMQNASSELIIQNASNGPIIFYDDTTERMRITQDGNVGIGTPSPGTDAILDLSSVTDKAVRLPNATDGGISTPTAGMIIYDTDTSKLMFYNGSAWETVTSAVV